jgi:tol-pal system protein YbgF
MNKPFSLGAVALAAWTAAAAPVMAQNREHQQLTADARMLQEQTQQLAIAVAQLAESLNQAVKAINTRIDDVNNANRKGFADQKLIIDNMASDVRVVRERTDDTNLRIATLREELEALRGSMVTMQQQVSLAPPPVVDPNAPFDPNAPTAAVQPPPSVPAPLPSTLGLSPSRMFDTARGDYFAGQYSLAISGFDAFLKAFPRSEMAGEAQHLIGESYASQGRFEEAVTAYNAVIQTYPTSSIVPETYYKRGIGQERLGQADAARESWETVVKMFPDSDSARLAKQGLDRLARQSPPTPQP